MSIHRSDVWAAGFAHAGQPMLVRSMAADVVDSDNVESGGQRTGLYLSGFRLTREEQERLRALLEQPAALQEDAERSSPTGPAPPSR